MRGSYEDVVCVCCCGQWRFTARYPNGFAGLVKLSGICTRCNRGECGGSSVKPCNSGRDGKKVAP